MVGAPGAGKGTQAALLSERLGVPHVASGDLFRDNIKRGTALGKQGQEATSTRVRSCPTT